ncbi:hypothetical protein [Gordonia humi]|uniref:DUF732 domain-containing protein n=1 Tax=Gordonia humi TaxID=686429 RepID=A0A840ESY2_9ACTN|nr:hypothetical protein [Gordonia humi]MBB4135995.1 hypothetical protein [Gordonia humi]
MALRHDRVRRGTTRIALATMACAVAMSAAVTGTAQADTSESAVPTPDAPPRSAPSATLDDAVKPGVPQPVAEGSFGYIATPSATKWMHDRHPEDVIANLPVGHHSDNQMMAQLLGGQLDAAVAQRGACVQIIVGGPRDGGLFTYGFYAVEPEYCPR